MGKLTDILEKKYCKGYNGCVACSFHCGIGNKCLLDIIRKEECEFEQRLRTAYPLGSKDIIISNEKITRSEILSKANEIISGEREKQYGGPEDSFKRITGLWSAYLGVELSSKDVANMMILLKVARNAGGSKLDNYIDIAGYAACGGEIEFGGNKNG